MQELSRAPNTAKRKVSEKKIKRKQKVAKSHQSAIKAENGPKHLRRALLTGHKLIKSKPYSIVIQEQSTEQILSCRTGQRSHEPHTHTPRLEIGRAHV